MSPKHRPPRPTAVVEASIPGRQSTQIPTLTAFTVRRVAYPAGTPARLEDITTAQHLDALLRLLGQLQATRSPTLADVAAETQFVVVTPTWADAEHLVSSGTLDLAGLLALAGQGRPAAPAAGDAP